MRGSIWLKNIIQILLFIIYFGFCLFVLISGKLIRKSRNSSEKVLGRKRIHMSSSYISVCDDSKNFHHLFHPQVTSRRWSGRAPTKWALAWAQTTKGCTLRWASTTRPATLPIRDTLMTMSCLRKSDGGPKICIIVMPNALQNPDQAWASLVVERALSWIQRFNECNSQPNMVPTPNRDRDFIWCFLCTTIHEEGTC